MRRWTVPAEGGDAQQEQRVRPSQQRRQQDVGWTVALVVGVLVFTVMSVSAWSGIRQTLSL